MMKDLSSCARYFSLLSAMLMFLIETEAKEQDVQVLQEEMQTDTLFEPHITEIESWFYIKTGMMLPLDDYKASPLSVGVGIRFKLDIFGTDISYTQLAFDNSETVKSVRALGLIYPTGKSFYFGIGCGHVFESGRLNGFCYDQMIGYRWPVSRIFIQLELAEFTNCDAVAPSVFIGKAF